MPSFGIAFAPRKNIAKRPTAMPEQPQRANRTGRKSVMIKS